MRYLEQLTVQLKIRENTRHDLTLRVYIKYIFRR